MRMYRQSILKACCSKSLPKMYMIIDYPTHVAKEYSKYATIYVYTYIYIDLLTREC